MKTLLFLLAATGATLAHPGIGIVKDTKGNVFYTDLAQVWKINPSGAKSVVVTGVHTHELYIDEFDNLYGEHLWYNGEVTNTWVHYVWKRTPGGQLEKIIPDKEGFREDFSFVRDHLGRSYRVDGPAGCQHILKIEEDKTTLMPGGDFKNIRWMATSRSGSLYVIDGGNVLKMEPGGCVSDVALNLPRPSISQFQVNKDHYLGGIAVDRNENVYVCDYSARNIKRIAVDGNITVIAETSFPWGPTGILVDEEKGELWVLENSLTNAVRVERINKVGRKTVFE